jgi:hypothetical protein
MPFQGSIVFTFWWFRYKYATVTQRFRQIVRDPQIVREFPVDLLRAMSADSSQPSKGPWSVTLHPYIYRRDCL